jgi:hypothetical protein
MGQKLTWPRAEHVISGYAGIQEAQPHGMSAVAKFLIHLNFDFPANSINVGGSYRKMFIPKANGITLGRLQ